MGSSLKEITVHTWEELNSVLFEETPHDGSLSNIKYNFIYRGMSCCDFSLSTSLMRSGGNLSQVEDWLLEDFEKYSNLKANGHQNDWSLLATAQHYGLPTRLLDWTFSPFVALHFCTNDPNLYHLDGAIWAIDTEEANRKLPHEIRTLLGASNSNYLNVNSLSKVSTSLYDFKQNYPDKDFVIFFEPPSLDQRIVNQFALFSMASKVELQLDKWLESNPTVGKKIIIPFKLKWTIRDKLDKSNITERVLFPGFDGLTNWIKRKNSPKGMNNDFIIAIKQFDNYLDNFFIDISVEHSQFVHLIDMAISYGAPAYNTGQYDKCLAMYKYAALCLLDLRTKRKLEWKPEWLHLKTLIKSEEKMSKNSFIWDLRRAFDAIKRIK